MNEMNNLPNDTAEKITFSRIEDVVEPLKPLDILATRENGYNNDQK